MYDVEAGASPQCHDVAFNLSGDLFHRHEGAESHKPIRQRVAIGKQLGAHARADPVGADQSRTVEAAPVLRCHTNDVAAVVEPHHHGVGHEGDQWLASTSVEQGIVHIDAVDDDVGIFEASAKRGTSRHARYFLAVECVEHQQGRRTIGFLEHSLAHADAIERVKDVRAKLDSIANGTKCGSAFKDNDGP